MAAAKTTPKPRIVQEFPAATREATYPWEEWTDGEIRELVKGVHFKGSVKSMRQTIGKYARSHGLKHKTRLVKDATGKELLYIQLQR